MSPCSIIAFYKFFPIAENELSVLQKLFDAEGTKLGVSGLLLIATEGINGTIAGNADAINLFKKLIIEKAGELIFKHSTAETNPFKRYRVKIRSEIVHIGDTELFPKQQKNNHVSPEEWDAMLMNDDVVVIDARNEYETAIGMFQNAVDPKLKTFQEFPDYVKSADIPKDKKVMMYCTGGIRCEKALLEMQRQGYEHVYQLDGGILNYLEKRPDGFFKGECFVFDHRVAVDSNLQPSKKYFLCPHCGDPADQKIVCSLCTSDAVVCRECREIDQRKTCSKNCANHVVGCRC